MMGSIFFIQVAFCSCVILNSAEQIESPLLVRIGKLVLGQVQVDRRPQKPETHISRGNELRIFNIAMSNQNKRGVRFRLEPDARKY
jgi:hypothetical protein